MYEILLISDDKGFTNLALKFIPHINEMIRVSAAATVLNGMAQLDRNPYIDLVVIDHDVSVDVFDLLNAMGRASSSLPVIMLSRNPSADLLTQALNTQVNFFLSRGGREPMEFFSELDQKIVLAAERQRNEVQRRINERRMEALIDMAKMGDQDFQKVVHFAMDKSIELTNSKIGYVSLYDKESRILKMMAWSVSAMKHCEVGSYSFDFDLDSTGIWGDPIRTGKTIIVNDYEGDTRVMKRGLPMGHVQLRRLLMVPIFLNGELIGTAGVGNKERDYTWFDEVQLLRLMEEMFLIHSKVEEVKQTRGQVGVIRSLLESGPYGFMYVTVDMNVVILNGKGAEIIGSEPVKSSFVPLEEIQTQAALDLRGAINSSRLYGRDESIRLTHSTQEGDRTYEVRVTNLADPTNANPGFAISMIDITDLKTRDEIIDRAMEHISILEGPVNTYAREVVHRMLSMQECRGDLRRETDNIREAVEFVHDYRQVGIKSPLWMPMTEVLGKAIRDTDVTGLDISGRVEGLKVLADPAFHVVFRHLLSNTVEHSGGASSVDVSFRIQNGYLTLVYSDDGCDIPEDKRGRIFDDTEDGKFGMFLAKNICQASGFTIRCAESERGACFEISVPASKYTIG